MKYLFLLAFCLAATAAEAAGLQEITIPAEAGRPQITACPDKITLCAQMHRNEIPAHPSGDEPRFKAFVIADPLNSFPAGPA